MFPSFKVLKRSRFESETTLQLKQGLGYVKEANNSQDCNIQTSVWDQPSKASSTRIGARIGTFDVNKLY